jgi:competence protein ComEA
MTILLRLLATALLPALAWAQSSGTMETMPNCRLVPAPWADGDSFPVRTPAGGEFTVRLYGVDCLETSVADKSNAERLREQRRYFGISEAGGSPQSSIALALEHGKLATAETARLLSRPFTVHTARADARGDGRHSRVYAFITTADGRDLGEELVARGLARAFGVYRELPDGTHRDIYRDRLRDLELQAAKLGRGVWAHTDWEKLPAERQSQREELADLGIAKTGSKPAPAGRVNLNTAARDQLMTLPGIGEVMANRIIENRPYRRVEEISRVEGIGPKRLEALLPFLTLAAPD